MVTPVARRRRRIAGLRPFSPLRVPDCMLWIEADRGITTVDGLVSAWVDQSGNSRNLAQDNAANRPSYNTAPINDLPTVTFGEVVSTSCQLTLSAFAVPATGFEFILVGRITDVADTAMKIIASSSNTAYIATGKIKLYANALTDAIWGSAVADPAVFSFRVAFDAAPWRRVNVNGGTAVTRNDGGATGGNFGTTFGSYGANQLEMDVAAFLIYPLLTDAQRLYLERGYGKKYNITVA